MILRVKATGLLVVSAVLFATPVSSQDATETWRGLVVAPEHRCSPYDRKPDYSYPQSIEQDIARGLGSVYGPYTDTCFVSARQTDIEHIVATRGARFGPVRQQQGGPSAFRLRPAQPPLTPCGGRL